MRKWWVRAWHRIRQQAARLALARGAGHHLRMPYVNIQITTGATRAQKSNLVRDVTDSLVRETLTQAISRLGYEVEHADPEAVDIRELPEAAVLFAPAEILEDYGPLLPPRQTTVEIGARGVRPTSERPVLRVPFALGELRRVLNES